MKTRLGLIALLSISFAVTLVVPALTGCSTPPTQRVTAAQTLKATGQIAEGAVTVAAQLFRDGRITAVQARQVMDFYDNRFQPAFRLAVATGQSDLQPASPDLVALATQLAALVAEFQRKAAP